MRGYSCQKWIYEDDIALDYLKAIDDAVKDAGIVSHTATLRDYYNSINTFPYREQVQTVLILMAIEAKKKFHAEAYYSIDN